MEKILSVLALVSLMACTSSREPVRTDRPGASINDRPAGPTGQAGWQSLFDGKTTHGWHVFNHKSDGSAWKVADGVLYLDAEDKNGRGDLVTDETYENFDLQLEWKISPAGNSGIIFQVKEDPQYGATYVTGPEMQIIDNNGHPDAKFPKHRAGDLYDLIACSKETVRPQGQWNRAEIIADHGQLDLFLNGVKVVSTTQWDAGWDSLVVHSKFKNMPDFGKFQEGRIALQDHGEKVSFRHIRIKKLP